jgi:hypothetical protein
MDLPGQAKPTASATIEPKGSRMRDPREHVVKVTIKLSAIEPKFTDKSYLTGVAQSALAGFRSASGDADACSFGDILGKTGNKVVGIEGSVVCSGRPDGKAIESLREALSAGGYNVQVRELRECMEDECMSVVMGDWNRPTEVPQGWYSNVVCGKHGYRSCASCKSIYVMSCTNANGQAPSVHCEVCGTIMVEWGGTKVWNAQLVTKRGQMS